MKFQFSLLVAKVNRFSFRFGFLNARSASLTNDNAEAMCDLTDNNNVDIHAITESQNTKLS